MHCFLRLFAADLLQSVPFKQTAHVFTLTIACATCLMCKAVYVSSGLSADVHAEDPLVGSIAQQYITDREAHDKQAAEWTRRFAQG